MLNIIIQTISYNYNCDAFQFNPDLYSFVQSLYGCAYYNIDSDYNALYKSDNSIVNSQYNIKIITIQTIHYHCDAFKADLP